MSARILLGFLVGSCLLALVGCGGDGGGDDSQSSFQPCDLMITEMMPNPKNPKKTGWEYVELFNASKKDIDLRDVRLDVQADGGSVKTQRFIWETPILIKPGEYFIVHQAEDEKETLEETDKVRRFWYTKKFLLPNKAFTITLRSIDGAKLHSLRVGAEGEVCDPNNPSLPMPTEGISLELQPGFFACTDSSYSCEAWTSAWQQLVEGSTDYGTPGVAPTEKPSGVMPKAGELAVTEIMAASGDDCGEVDWFELKNLTDKNLNLEGCTIGDGSKYGDHVIVAPAIVPKDGYGLFATARMDGVETAYVFTKTNLNKTGDWLYIHCPTNGADAEAVTVLDVKFGGEGELPKPANGSSIGVCLDTLDGMGLTMTQENLQRPDLWQVTRRGPVGCGTDLGSPGKANLPCECEPVCQVGVCDNDDGCGGLCGCGENGFCQDGTCQCATEPQCDDKECGDDACGGSCGDCAQGQICSDDGIKARCGRYPSALEVIPTEFTTGGAGDCEGLEWIELKNLTAEDLILSGCQLSDASDTGKHLISSTLVIPAGGYTLLSSDETPFLGEDYVYSKVNLNQGGDLITLECPGESGLLEQVFSVTYGSAALPAPDKGRSAQLCPDRLAATPTAEDMLAPEAWSISLTGNYGCGMDTGTPGSPNASCDCNPACSLGSCGMADGCGGTCGCGENQTCISGTCQCDTAVDCTGRECGDDGCGGSCGQCGDSEACSITETSAVCVRVPGEGEVAPTEINSYSSDSCSGVDWFELYNLTNTDLLLQGCKIGDASSTGEHLISEPLTIPAGGYVLLSSQAMAGIEVDYVFAKPNLNQTEDTLWMKCPSGNDLVTVFSVTYGGGEGELPKASQGSSLGLCLDRLSLPYSFQDMVDPANWVVTSQGAMGCGGDKGTPGEANVPCDCNVTCTPGTCDNSDGCGGTCGCAAGEICNSGTCECEGGADCTNRTCGSDGCGGSCGTCAEDLTCVEGEDFALCARTPVSGDLIPTEIMVNASEGCGAMDWVEVMNLSTAILNLKGCTLADAASTYSFNKDVLIPGSDLLVLVQAAQTIFPTDKAFFYGSTPNLNKAGDDIRLTCGEEVFAVQFGTGDTLIPKPMDQGDPLIRVAVQLDLDAEGGLSRPYAQDPLNWCYATQAMSCQDLGTPGLANSACSF